MSPFLRQKIIHESIPYAEIDASEKELIKAYRSHFDAIWEDRDKTESIWYVFSWDEIPGMDNGRLIEFLEQNYDIGWAKNAEIEKIDKTITASAGEKSLSIRLNDEKNEAIMEINGVRSTRFEAALDNGKLKIYWV